MVLSPVVTGATLEKLRKIPRKLRPGCIKRQKSRYTVISVDNNRAVLSIVRNAPTLPNTAMGLGQAAAGAAAVALAYRAWRLMIKYRQFPAPLTPTVVAAAGQTPPPDLPPYGHGLQRFIKAKWRLYLFPHLSSRQMLEEVVCFLLA